MIAPLAKFIDWYSLQFFWALRLRSIRNWRADLASSNLAAALDFLNGPDFIPLESQPAKVEITGQVHFRFPSPRPCEFAANNIVPGRLYRSADRWQQRPAVILLHGGGDFLNHRLRFPCLVPALNRAGYNVATMVAPYHFARRPKPLPPGDFLRSARAFSQGVAEVRALTGWLMAQGCPSVALWGVSLGGWYSGLAALRDSRVGAVVMAVPGVRVDYKFTRAERVIWRRVREMLQAQSAARERLNTTPLNLTLMRPVIPRENILLIEGIYDQFVEPEAIEKLWQSWQQPEIWRLPHGHISWMFAPGVTGRVIRWLTPRLDKTPS